MEGILSHISLFLLLQSMICLKDYPSLGLNIFKLNFENMVYGGDAAFNLFICVLSDADDMKLFTYSNFKIIMMLPNIEKSIKSDVVEYQKINLA